MGDPGGKGEFSLQWHFSLFGHESKKIRLINLKKFFNRPIGNFGNFRVYEQKKGHRF